MNMITEDYVSFEVAMLLKEKGFNEECRSFWKKWDGDCHLYKCDTSQSFQYCSNSILKRYNDDSELNVAAPTLQMATKWLREMYDVHVVPKFDFYAGTYTGRVYDGRRETALDRSDYIAIAGCKSYEEACNEAIRYCLEKLV